MLCWWTVCCVLCSAATGSILKRPITAPATLGMVDYQSTDHEQLMKRLRPAQSVEEVTYPTSRQHATWSLGDLPRTVACTMHQGSAVTSMDFHSAHHTLLLGVYADLLVAPISPSELGAGAGLPDIPIDPQAFGIYAVLLGPLIDGIYADLLGPPIDGIYADMLGPPIDGVYPDLLVAAISPSELGAGAGLLDVLIDPLAFVIASGFHALYLESMVNCSGRTILKFEELLEREGLNGGKEIELDLEEEFSSLALDIIGLSVFNYDFGSVTKESPIIKAVYGTLFEAEHRSTFYIPYWNIPLARWLVPRQRKFQKDLKVINDCLDGLIRNAKETRQETDVEKLQQRDYSNLKDASLLRFLVDMRGADVDDRQLRDDLMTMLIAGHETTAAVLTWAVFLLAQNPSKMKKAQAEIDLVLGQGRPSFESLKKLEFIRLIIVEALRLFPQPPLLIRRTLKSDLLPGGYNGNKDGYAIPAGTDIFLSVYNLHRSPYFWDKPHEFEPERFLAQKNSGGIEGWAGFDPSRSPGALYPNEIISDFSFLPFGGGPRKCVGDQFALMESTVALAMLLQNFDVELKGSPESVELVTGATIHTKNGLWCKLKKRSDVH